MVKQRQKAKLHDSPYKRFERDKESDNDTEETELFVKNRSPKREMPTVEKIIEEEDTLQSLAIRYACTIEDLKRINNIHKENEIYAKRTIKVPHYPISSALAAVHVSGKNSPESINEPSTSKLIDIDTLNTKLTDKITLSPKNQDEVNEIIFNSNIAQKSAHYSCDETTDIIDEEVYLLDACEKVGEQDLVVNKLNFNGADCDISWVALIICIVIVIVAIPLIYVVYIAEHPDQYHHHVS